MLRIKTSTLLAAALIAAVTLPCPFARGEDGIGEGLTHEARALGGLSPSIPNRPGSPSATTTIDGKQLPAPPSKFGGKIERSTVGSHPYWPPRIVPPKGAPNVLLIMTDDSGYGVPSTFGGVIPTPALDRVAANGLRYTNFHSTALCSPTRAALITGRNHHSVGFGVISEQATGYPGYDSIITKDKATIGQILKDNGYRTSWFGKNHNTPSFQATSIGPFDQWPIGMGFEYFYGFMGGDTNQWEPANLARNTTYIYPFLDNPGYNLITAMADEAIAYMDQVNTLTPDQPFFVYYVPGGTHAPHHPTPEWIKKISDMHLFDQGWNKLREQIFANQKKLGVIPENAKLTPWPKDLLKEWDQLSADEKKMFIRQADVFAAYVAYTDHEIGRVIQAVEDMGKLDNTLIIYINGDNGTSAEGTLVGTPERGGDVQWRRCSGAGAAQGLLRRLGLGPDLQPHGGRLGLGVRYAVLLDQADRLAPRRRAPGHGDLVAEDHHRQGRHSHQFHHVIDIVPTILDATGIKAPDTVDGIKQSPIEGVSMTYTFDKKNAKAPSTHKTQYFEMFGDRALYHDGWLASTKVMRAPWVHAVPKENVLDYPWELYNLNEDWTQSRTSPRKYPAKLKELQDALLERSGEVPGAAARRDARRAADHAAAERHRRPQRVHVDAAAHRHARTATRRACSTRRTTSRPRSRSRKAAPRACSSPRAAASPATASTC